MTKKKSFLKAIGISVLAVMMAIMFSIPSFIFAAPGQKQDTEPKGTIAVSGVESSDMKNVKVVAYKVAEAKYDKTDNKTADTLVGYELVKAVKDYNNTATENDKIKLEKKGDKYIIAKNQFPKLAGLITENLKKNTNQIKITPIEMTAKQGEAGTYEYKEATVGYYIVIVSGTDGYVYNPALIGISYNDQGQALQSEKLTLVRDKKIENDNDLISNYIKKAKVKVEKETVKDAAKGAQQNDKKIKGGSSMAPIDKGGMTGAEKDNINFKVSTAIPSYNTDVYKSAKFKITDTLSTGLTFNTEAKDVVVKVGGTEVKAQENGHVNYTSKVDGHTLTIEFESNYILNHTGQTVTVEYSAFLNGNAVTGFNPNTNDVVVDYSNNPNTDDTGKVKDRNYHYTFEIDGVINGLSTDKTKEVFKTGEEKVQNSNEKAPLQGAVFQLTRYDANKKNALQFDGNGKVVTTGGTEAIFTATTNDKGLMNFKGLSEGTYKLRETKAPKGYTLENQDHWVVIKAEYNDNGTLKTYSITIDDQATSTYTGVYKKDDATTIEKVTGNQNSTEIKNTKTPSLPSTGGIGTYIFTMVGVAMIVIAAGVYFKRRKDCNEK